MVLFACDEPEITYQLNFDTNGGTEIESVIIDQNTQLTLPEDPVKEGYMFWGWYLDDTTFINAFTNDSLDNLDLSNDLTIYAKWVNNNNVVEIIINTAGGPSYDSFYVERGETIELPQIVREGYTIDYWFTIIDQHLYTIEDGIFEVNYPISEITLQISWIMDIYLVNYELNGGINNPENISYYVTTDAIELYDPEKEGYVFMGWYDNEDFTGNTINEIPIGSNIDYTLYAKWEIGQFQITYNIYDSDISYVDFPLEIGQSVRKISIGSDHFGLLTSDGQVYTWGDNYYGQLGYYSISRYAYPSNITHRFDLQVGEEISNIFMNSKSSYAVTTLNRVFAWGYNYYGQLGDGTTIDRFDPIDITDQFNLLPDETIIQYTSSFYFSMVVTSSGRVLAWGKDNYIWLDGGQHVAELTPTDMTIMFNLNVDEKIVNAEVSGYRAIAISSTGRVFEWGDNKYGAPGDGTLVAQFVPVEITNAFNLIEDEVITQVDFGYFSSIALSSTGRIFTWGNNDYGQLGNGTGVSSYIPIDITDQFLLDQNESIVDISGGSSHFVVITSSNRIFTWGYIYHGVLYEITNPFQLVPLDITERFVFNENETISNLSVGGLNSLIITSENRVLAWGYINQYLISGSVVSWITHEILLDHIHLAQSFEINTYQEIIDLYVPDREGYTFSGWYMDSRFIIEFELTTMPHYDLMLYGYWIPND